MLTKLRTKIRALIEDNTKSDFQIFKYTNSNIFTLAEANVVSVTKILVDGNELGSGESYSFDSSTNKITFTGVTFTTSSVISVDFTYNKYSDTELNEYIRASLVWLSVYEYTTKDWELESSGIYPTPNNKDLDLIAIISSILIKPDCVSYKLDKVSVKYPSKLSKEERIKDIISFFNNGIGAVGFVKINDSYYETENQDEQTLVGILSQPRYKDLEVFRLTQHKIALEIQTKLGYLEDLTGGAIYLTVKENMEDADGSAKISKDLTPTSPTTGQIGITLSTTDTDLIGNYYYDIKYVDSSSNSYILFSGRIKFIESVTERA